MFGDNYRETYVAPFERLPEKDPKRFVEPQTKIAAAGYALIYLAMVVAAGQTSSSAPGTPRMCMMTSPVLMVFVLFGINCIVRGNCNTFAWIISYFFLVMGMLATIVAFNSR
jgi:hypothetical protein